MLNDSHQTLKEILPKIIFGTSALGNLYIDQPESIKTEIVAQCLQHAKQPVVFDSAGKYGAGMALEMLGRILEKLDVPAENVIISNKLGWKRIPLTTQEPTFEPGVWKGLSHDAIQQISYGGIIECFEQGNQLLGTKYSPQLISVHDPDEYLAKAKSPEEYERLFFDITEAYRALADLKKQGKIKAIGVGSKDWKVIHKLAAHISFDWVMFANSFTIMNHPADLLEFMDKLHQKGVCIVNSAVFQGGFLTGSNYYDYRLVTTETDLSKFQWREEFFSLCKKYNISPAVACVNFGMTPPGVAAISLNTSNPNRVKDNVSLVEASVPSEFYIEMVTKGLINKDYPYLGL